MDIDVGGWSGSVTSSKSSSTSTGNNDACSKCGAGGFYSIMLLRTHERHCGKESDAESLSAGKENVLGHANNDIATSTIKSATHRRDARSKSKSKSRMGRSRSPLRSMMQRARSRSPTGATNRGVSFMRDRTPKRTGRGGFAAAGVLSPADASTPCISNRGAHHIASGYITTTESFVDALEGRPSAVDLIPELGMGGAMASLASRCVAVDSICPCAGIDKAVADYRRNVLGITDRSFKAMALEEYKDIPLL